MNPESKIPPNKPFTANIAIGGGISRGRKSISRGFCHPDPLRYSWSLVSQSKSRHASDFVIYLRVHVCIPLRIKVGEKFFDRAWSFCLRFGAHRGGVISLIFLSFFFFYLRVFKVVVGVMHRTNGVTRAWIVKTERILFQGLYLSSFEKLWFSSETWF